MMNYLVGGGQIVVGVGLLFLWWLTLTLLGRRWSDQPMGAVRFAVIPCIFLIWLVLGFIIALRGLGAV
jgi:hypothetical protein